jgi:ribosomal protein S18 acetylase RimI-like enzyme
LDGRHNKMTTESSDVALVAGEATDEIRIVGLKKEHLPQSCEVLKDAFQSKRFLGCFPVADSITEMTKRYEEYPQRKWDLGAVAVDSNNSVLGFIQMTDADLPMYPAGLHSCKTTEIYIETAGVSAQARGKGIGGKLLAWCDETAKSCNKYTLLSLSVLRGNSAIRLYERHGFVIQNEDDVVEQCCDAMVVCCLFGRPYGCSDSGWGSVTMHKAIG